MYVKIIFSYNDDVDIGDDGQRNQSSLQQTYTYFNTLPFPELFVMLCFVMCLTFAFTH